MTDTFFIFCAKYLFLLSVLICGIYFLRIPMRDKKRLLVLAVPALILSYIVAKIGSHLYSDPRPFVVGNFTPLIPHAPDNGFPSDHTLLVSVLASIATFFNKRLAIALWVIAVLVAVARVYVGVHHPIDVIGSMVIAVIGTYVVHLTLRKFLPRI